MKITNMSAYALNILQNTLNILNKKLTASAQAVAAVLTSTLLLSSALFSSISEAQLLTPAQNEAQAGAAAVGLTPGFLNFNVFQNNGEPLKPSDDVDLVALKERIFPGKITQVSAGDFHTCALDADGVKCWGGGSGTTNGPKLNHPTQVEAEGNHTCALDADGVKCWGDNRNGETSVPKLNHPTQVSAGGNHNCALDADGVKCWGYNEYGQTDVPKLNHPTQVSAGATYTCALDVDGVKCWGADGSGKTNVPKLNHPTQVSAGSEHTCAVDDYGVTCWGHKIYNQTNVPKLNHPTQVSAGGYHTCALDADGVKCWGDNEDGKTDVPLLKGISKLTPYTNIYLNGVYTSSTPVRAKYLLAMLTIAEKGQYILGSNKRPTNLMIKGADYIKDANLDSTLKQKYTSLAANLDLLYQLQEPVIYSGDSDAYLGVLIPEYEKVKAQLKKFIADNKIAAAKLKDPRSAYLVLYSMRTALDGMKTFLMPEDRSQITAQVQTIDSVLITISESKSVPSLKPVLDGYEAVRTIISQLEQAPRAWFLPQASDRAYQLMKAQ